MLAFRNGFKNKRTSRLNAAHYFDHDVDVGIVDDVFPIGGDDNVFSNERNDSGGISGNDSLNGNIRTGSFNDQVLVSLKNIVCSFTHIAETGKTNFN